MKKKFISIYVISSTLLISGISSILYLNKEVLHRKGDAVSKSIGQEHKEYLRKFTDKETGEFTSIDAEVEYNGNLLRGKFREYFSDYYWNVGLRGAVSQLGKCGTSEAIKYLEEFLAQQEALLPEVPPTLAEIGKTKGEIRFFFYLYSGGKNPESFLILAASSLILTETEEGEIAVEQFRERISKKYGDSEYGKTFLQYFDERMELSRTKGRENLKREREYQNMFKKHYPLS